MKTRIRPRFPRTQLPTEIATNCRREGPAGRRKPRLNPSLPPPCHRRPAAPAPLTYAILPHNPSETRTPRVQGSALEMKAMICPGLGYLFSCESQKQHRDRPRAFVRASRRTLLRLSIRLSDSSATFSRKDTAAKRFIPCAQVDLATTAFYGPGDDHLRHTSPPKTLDLGAHLRQAVAISK